MKDRSQKEPSVPDAALREAILRWYTRSRRRLPWRDRPEPYAVWVAEVMLQQTQVATVVPYYERFLERFPTVEALAEASLDEVLKAWEGLGYYARARNLHRAARTLRDRCGGRLPRDPEALRRLPGIGEYIAAAIASIAFGRPVPVVDGNVVRWLSRLVALEDPVDRPPGRRRLKTLAEALLDRERPGDWNQASMELGALVCRPRDPRCGECPAARWCLAHRRGEPTAYPKRSPRRPIPTVEVAVAVIRKEDRVLVTQRPPEGHLGGLWEFPGGRIEPGETPEEACRREVAEETGLEVAVRRPLARVRHAYSHFKVRLHIFECELLGGEVRLEGPVDYRWITREEAGEYAFPAADHRFLPLVWPDRSGEPRGGDSP
jgi:A/G-specific adenine glycosylase